MREKEAEKGDFQKKIQHLHKMKCRNNKCTKLHMHKIFHHALANVIMCIPNPFCTFVHLSGGFRL